LSIIDLAPLTMLAPNEVDLATSDDPRLTVSVRVAGPDQWRPLHLLLVRLPEEVGGLVHVCLRGCTGPEPIGTDTLSDSPVGENPRQLLLECDNCAETTGC